MIETFGNTRAEDLFDDRRTKATRSFPPELRSAGRRKLLYLHDAGELKDLGVPLNELIKGKRGVTAAAALDLAEVLGTTPKLWMNLQATYDLDKAASTRRVA